MTFSSLNFGFIYVGGEARSSVLLYIAHGEGEEGEREEGEDEGEEEGERERTLLLSSVSGNNLSLLLLFSFIIFIVSSIGSIVEFIRCILLIVSFRSRPSLTSWDELYIYIVRPSPSQR